MSKRPTDYARGEIGVGTDNYGLARLNADVSGPVDESGKWLYRVVGTAYHSDTQVDYVKLNRVMLAPSLTWRPSARTSVTLLANYQQDRGGSTYQFLPSHGTYYATDHGRFGSGRFLGEPGFNRYDRTQYAIGYEFSHALTDQVKVSQKLRYMRVDTDNAGVSRQGDLQADGRTPGARRPATRSVRKASRSTTTPKSISAWARPNTPCSRAWTIAPRPSAWRRRQAGLHRSTSSTRSTAAPSSWAP